MEWQPIETAPTGKRILVCIPFGSGSQKTHRLFLASLRDTGWHFSGNGSWGKTPTHWQPLPEPPK